MNWHSRLLLDSHENADSVKFLIAIASGTEPALAFEDMIQALRCCQPSACVVPNPDQAPAHSPLCYDMTSLRGISPPLRTEFRLTQSETRPCTSLAVYFTTQLAD